MAQSAAKFWAELHQGEVKEGRDSCGAQVRVSGQGRHDGREAQVPGVRVGDGQGDGGEYGLRILGNTKKV